MRRKASKSPWELPKETSTIINAAAMQDHHMRSMALNVSPPGCTNLPRRVNSRSQPHQQEPEVQGSLKFTLQKDRRVSTAVVKTVPSSKVAAASSTGTASDHQLKQEYRRVWVCENCTYENEDRKDLCASDNRVERCGACASVRPSKPRRNQITLAQQRGLVPAPLPKLSWDDWDRCESQAIGRGDADHPCSICREPFGVQEQVILSCSHMFHLTCMQSFERFLRTKQRVCPLCRKENYQKRMTSKATSIYRMKCVVRLQAVFRGHVTRKQIEALWHEFYRRGNGDQIRRRAFLAKRVGRTTDRLVSAMRARDDSIDSLLAEFDKTISLSKQVFNDSQPQTDEGQTCASQAAPDWTRIYLKAQARAERECPICIHSFSTTMADEALLSCSHVFHRECLLAFEDFNIYEIPLCPLCRSGYQRRYWRELKT